MKMIVPKDTDVRGMKYKLKMIGDDSARSDKCKMRMMIMFEWLCNEEEF